MKTRNLVLTALFIAIGVALPQVLAPVSQIRALISPMHIPVFICGLAVGPMEGLICGLLTPALSHMLFGMPMIAGLPGMIVELGVYGLVSGLLMKAFKKIGSPARIYLSLILSMIAGRIAGGLLHALVLNAGEYSMAAWAASYITGTGVGIVVHLILIPLIVRALEKAKLTSV